MHSKEFKTKRVVSNLWRKKCTVLGYEVNNTKGEIHRVTQSAPLFFPQLPSTQTSIVCLLHTPREAGFRECTHFETAAILSLMHPSFHKYNYITPIFQFFYIILVMGWRGVLFIKQSKKPKQQQQHLCYM